MWAFIFINHPNVAFLTKIASLQAALGFIILLIGAVALSITNTKRHTLMNNVLALSRLILDLSSEELSMSYDPEQRNNIELKFYYQATLPGSSISLPRKLESTYLTLPTKDAKEAIENVKKNKEGILKYYNSWLKAVQSN
jgi:hypothetical protein